VCARGECVALRPLSAQKERAGRKVIDFHRCRLPTAETAIRILLKEFLPAVSRCCHPSSAHPVVCIILTGWLHARRLRDAHAHGRDSHRHGVRAHPARIRQALVRNGLGNRKVSSLRPRCSKCGARGQSISLSTQSTRASELAGTLARCLRAAPAWRGLFVSGTSDSGQKDFTYAAWAILRA
jgi:hypothetical protein